MKYTKETLTAINQRFCNTHYFGIGNYELEMANNYVDLIERTRSTTVPKAGDRIRYTDTHGDYYHYGHIEKIYEDDNEANICEQPYTPFIAKDENGNGIKCNTSGGVWCNIPINKLKYVGKEEKRFCDWGSCGACADGAVDFIASVSVWEYMDKQKYPYTTKTHNRMSISYNPKKFYNNRYIFFGSQNGISSDAWETEVDFQAWLHTFRGQVFKGNWHNQLIVWYWKEIKHSVSPSEFESIDAPEDTMMNNGSILRCKRIYDEENFTVHTYWVWYWDEPEKDWRQAAIEQNKIREKYYTLPYTTGRNYLAKTKILQGKVKMIDLHEFLDIEGE